MNAMLNVARVLNMSCKRYLSSGKLPSEIVIPIDKDMIICWHPKQEFPYEYSLPLPEEKQVVSNSFLCIDDNDRAEVYNYKERDAVDVEELSKMTYTTKHRWYPRKRIAKFRKPEPERPYL